ncbi:MAG: flagellar protein FlaG [Proteobacteria bacterium]|nr:flagellar protein FlaG [Pseudomonadota bacterium]MBU1710252.1 flagellar protein FlaG [Pseudomonadota bacterium]
MVDINMNTEAKIFGMPTAPAVEMENRSKPQILPIRESSDSSKAELDEKALRGKKDEPRKKSLSEEQASEIIDEVQQRLESMGTRLNLVLLKEPESVVVQVTDRKSGELIRQFPSEELLNLRAKLDDLLGLLLETEV